MTTPAATTPDTGRDEGAIVAALERTWRARGGLWGWLTAVDHKSIAKRYIATAFPLPFECPLPLPFCFKSETFKPKPLANFSIALGQERIAPASNSPCVITTCDGREF